MSVVLRDVREGRVFRPIEEIAADLRLCTTRIATDVAAWAAAPRSFQLPNIETNARGLHELLVELRRAQQFGAE